ncbi:MAG: hypothetical protein JZU55_14735 [Afipia sp.]|nr:hypothetical protein [Afipia sp.]
MPSQAAKYFADARGRGLALAALVQDVRLKPLPRDKRRILLHVALASHVAAWEAYVERLVASFFSDVNELQNPKYSAVLGLLQDQMMKSSEKFNTPNWENARQLLVSATGYDPINDWSWRSRRMPGPLLRARLNEILKVRHSFAHGYAMPSFPWNTSSSGDVRLTAQIFADVDAFFVNLVEQTDKGYKVHLLTNFGVAVGW